MRDNNWYQHQMEKFQSNNLPIKDKLVILDRDILSLKITDRELEKRIQQMTNLVRTQTVMVVLNMLVSLIIIYLVAVNDIFSVP